MAKNPKLDADLTKILYSYIGPNGREYYIPGHEFNEYDVIPEPDVPNRFRVQEIETHCNEHCPGCGECGNSA